MSWVILVLVLLVDLGDEVGGVCEPAVVTHCNELCHPSLRRSGIVEVRFRGVWANVRCLPPAIRVCITEKNKNFLSVSFRFKGYRCHSKVISLASVKNKFSLKIEKIPKRNCCLLTEFDAIEYLQTKIIRNRTFF